MPNDDAMKHEQDTSGADGALEATERTLRVLCHELSGLIDGASRYVEMARGASSETEASGSVDRYLGTASAALSEAGRMLKAVRLGRDAARAPISRLASMRPVGEAVDHAIDLARTLAMARSIEIIARVDDGFRSLGAAPIFPVINNALRNALEMTARNGTIEVRARVETQDSGKRWGVVEVLDDGPGPTDDAERHAFELGYSTRRGGLGVGLALAQSIVHDLGGRITLGSRAAVDGRRGGALTVWWPIREESSIGRGADQSGGQAA